jgi:hypothetical protein
MKGMFIGLAALVVAMGVAFGLLLSNAYTTIDSLRSDTAQYSATTGQLQAADTRIKALTTEVGAISGQVKSTSPDGDLITCADLSLFQQDLSLTLYGTDSMNGNISGSASEAGNPWLPSHCFKGNS